jgi:hypothetical protein
MADTDLRHLVQRRLFELQSTLQQASMRSRGALPRETLHAIAHGLHPVGLTDRLVAALARALDVPEYRVRRAAGLPAAEPMIERTRPNLRVVRRDE